jgi:carbamoyl-phosphate synthase small subunit|tara:strand:+ start:545 stop:739 length:195 start_codon:yes stop_codon:yes gene_type:complete
MENTKEVVASLGGRTEAAKLCGISGDAVKKWEQGNAIPSKHWQKIVRATNGAASFDMLAEIAAK